jgi:CBS domain-containing protein
MKLANHVVTAEEIMRRKLVTVRPETPVLDSVALMLKENISGVPVVDHNQKYLGVFSEKSCFRALTHMVEAAGRCGLAVPHVNEFMNRQVVFLTPETDVFAAIEKLLAKRISGAPVVDDDGCYLGIFSEKTAMAVVIQAIYDQVPGSQISRYMNLDRQRLIQGHDSLLHVASRFLNSPYRRLPVLDGGHLAGQVSRRDALRAEYRLVAGMDRITQQAIDTDEELANFRQGSVVDYMDRHALTKEPTADLLAIAEAFLNSPYRRLPIVSSGVLLGQISRRDLLEVAVSLLRPEPVRETAKTLYLSAVSHSIPPSLS